MVLLPQLTPTPCARGRGTEVPSPSCYLLMHQMFCRTHLETGMLKCPGGPYPSASDPTACTALLDTSTASAS